MLAWITFAILAVSFFALSRVPRNLLRAYCLSFASRHGLSVQFGLTLLAAVTVSMLFATLLQPGAKPIMEQVNAAVVILALVAGRHDLRAFARSRAPK